MNILSISKESQSVDKELLEYRLNELLQPIYRQIQMCDSSEEIALLSIGLLNIARHNLDLHLSVVRRKLLFKEWS
jgi:hypothetical protein